MIGVAVLGYGYWGPNLARNFAALPGARVIAIAEPDAARRAVAARTHPDVHMEVDAKRAIALPGVDAVVIATPPAQHMALALAAIAAGKHVLVEKPCGLTLGEARAIVGAASARRVTLMVDHTFVFAPAVEVLSSIVRAGEIGELVYAESIRTNLAQFDTSISVVRDLAVHDLSILDRVIGGSPSVLSVSGRARPRQPEDFAFVSLEYGHLPVRLHVDCISPVKIRRMTLGGTNATIVYDDVEPVEKIRLYRRHEASRTELRTGYRTGPVSCPPVIAEEALSRMAAHFLHCVESGAEPITGGNSILRLLLAIEAAEEILALSAVGDRYAASTAERSVRATRKAAWSGA